jgi:hypothetical protein
MSLSDLYPTWVSLQSDILGLLSSPIFPLESRSPKLITSLTALDTFLSDYSQSPVSPSVISTIPTLINDSYPNFLDAFKPEFLAPLRPFETELSQLAKLLSPFKPIRTDYFATFVTTFKRAISSDFLTARNELEIGYGQALQYLELLKENASASQASISQSLKCLVEIGTILELTDQYVQVKCNLEILFAEVYVQLGKVNKD